MQDRIKQFRSWEDNAQREIEEFHPVSSACVYAGMKEGEAEASNELTSIFDAALIEAKDITQHAVPWEFALREAEGISPHSSIRRSRFTAKMDCAG